MSKNVILNNNNYFGISTVQIPTTDGGEAEFVDKDDVIVPAGEMDIVNNGDYDVTEYKTVRVNVPTDGGSGSVYSGTFTVSEKTFDPMSFAAQGATHFTIRMTSEPDLSTGESFFYGVTADTEKCFAIQSGNSGNAAPTTGGVYPTGETNTSHSPIVTFTESGVTFAPRSAEGVADGYRRWVQTGASYAWYAW